MDFCNASRERKLMIHKWMTLVTTKLALDIFGCKNAKKNNFAEFHLKFLFIYFALSHETFAFVVSQKRTFTSSCTRSMCGRNSVNDFQML